MTLIVDRWYCSQVFVSVSQLQFSSTEYRTYLPTGRQASEWDNRRRYKCKNHTPRTIDDSRL